MANVKEYAYYIEGNKVAIVERDTAFDNNVDSKEYGPGVSRAMWKSPQSSVADGLEIKYAYAPNYFIETTNDVDENITQYQSTDGYLSIADNSSAYINYATTYALAADSYIVLRNAGRFNVLHKIKALSNNTGTNNKITLYTKYSGSEAAWSTFEETPKLYYAVDVLDNEADELNIPSYLEKALVYYVKGRLAEDAGELELKEYNMREYKKHIEQYESTLMKGPRIISSGFHAIR